MSSNKEIIQANTNIIRSLNFNKKEQYDEKAFTNFSKILQNIEKGKKLVFVLNSNDEINIIPWIELAIKKQHEVYLLHRKSMSNWFYYQINNTDFQVEWFKNRFQPKIQSLPKFKDVKFDHIFIPLVLFNINKEFVDDETSVIKRLVASIPKNKIIGYAYSLQCLKSTNLDKKHIEQVNTIITENYIIY